MDTTNVQALQKLDGLFQRRDFPALAQAAKETVQRDPNIAPGWRYLGIATFFCGENGWPSLLRAAAIGDDESAHWLSVMIEIGNFPQGAFQLNDVLQQVELARLRRSPYIGYPSEVHIETMAFCNAKCTFCPYPTMERKGDKMPDTLIDKIINDLKGIPQDLQFTIAPFKVNDPFLDKRIFAVCEKINSELPNAKLRLFTNGSPLTEALVEKIAKVQKLEHLWISLNASDPAEYEKLMGLPFQKTIQKLDMLHERVQSGYPHPVVVSRVSDGSPADEAFRRFVGERYPRFQCFMVKRENWTGQVDTGVRGGPLATGCGRWYEISIMASGKVALCCMDGEGKHVIGDVTKQSVLEVYNSPGYRKLRQFTFSRLAAASPCDTCAY